jgi:hypothetical protein
MGGFLLAAAAAGGGYYAYVNGVFDSARGGAAGGIAVRAARRVAEGRGGRAAVQGACHWAAAAQWHPIGAVGVGALPEVGAVPAERPPPPRSRLTLPLTQTRASHPKAPAKRDYAAVRKAIEDVLDNDDYDDGSYGPVLVGGPGEGRRAVGCGGAPRRPAGRRWRRPAGTHHPRLPTAQTKGAPRVAQLWHVQQGRRHRRQQRRDDAVQARERARRQRGPRGRARAAGAHQGQVPVDLLRRPVDARRRDRDRGDGR